MTSKRHFSAGSAGQRKWYVANGLILFSLLVLLFPVSEIKFSTDSMSYIAKGLWIAEDLKYADFTRGPMFPALTALSITIFGHTAFVLMAMVRVAYALSVVAFGYLAWRQYGLVGAWASVSYFALAPLVQWPATKFHVDIFLLVFILFAIVALFEAHRRESKKIGFVAGALLGCAFLTKETAILLFPLLAISWVAYPTNWRGAARISAAALIGLVAVLVPWGLLILVFTGEVSILLGENINSSGTFQKFTDAFFGAPGHMAVFVYERMLNFVRVYFLNSASFVAAMGVYGWILIAGVVYTLGRTVAYRRSGDLLIAAAFLLHIPFMIYLGWNTYDHRQALIIFALGAFGVGALFGDMEAGLARAMSWRRRMSALSVLGAFVLVTAVAMSFTPSFQDRFGGHFHSFTFYRSDEGSFTPSGALGPNLVSASAWLAKNTTPDATVMAAHPRPTRYMEFALENRVVAAPIEKYNLRTRPQTNLDGITTSLRRESDLVYINVNRSPNGPVKCVDDSREVKGARFCKLYFLRESNLVEKIKRTDAKYFLVTPRYSYIEKYLQQNAGLEKIKSFGTPTPQPSSKNLRELVTVYRITDAVPVDGYLRPAVTESFPRFLTFYREVKPREYEVWRSQVLSLRFGASDQQIAAIEDRAVDCFTYDLKRPQIVDCMKLETK